MAFHPMRFVQLPGHPEHWWALTLSAEADYPAQRRAHLFTFTRRSTRRQAYPSTTRTGSYFLLHWLSPDTNVEILPVRKHGTL